jgi:hypothetical protein
MMNKKLSAALVLPLLFVASQPAYAYLTSGTCSPGYTPIFVGTGFISGGSFVSGGAPFPGTPIYDCVAGESEDTTTTNTFQIERTNYSILNQHITSQIVKQAGLSLAAKSQNTQSASADSGFSPVTFWGETNFSNLTNHAQNAAGFSTNIYQFTGGFDKRQGDIFYGSTLTYAYTNNNLSNAVDSTMHTVGVTPYIAYKINDYLFASGLASYNYSNTSNSIGLKNEIDTHDYAGEANINAFKVINSFTLKGRAGVRYKHAFSSQKTGGFGRDSTFDEIAGIVDAQVDYRFDNGITVYTGALYNHYAREASGASIKINGNDVVWMRYGAEYAVAKGLLVGAKIENDLNDKTTNYLTGSLNVRLEI